MTERKKEVSEKARKIADGDSPSKRKAHNKSEDEKSPRRKAVNGAGNGHHFRTPKQKAKEENKKAELELLEKEKLSTNGKEETMTSEAAREESSLPNGFLATSNGETPNHLAVSEPLKAEEAQ